MLRRSNFHIVRNLLTGGPVGSFAILEGNITRRKKKKNTQTTHLTTTASGEVAQMLMSATSRQGLDREVKVA